MLPLALLAYLIGAIPFSALLGHTREAWMYAVMEQGMPGLGHLPDLQQGFYVEG